uniref:Uncharacterized protein n=1 Tax=Pseudomonas phage Nican01 TaxID=3138540 RepID=A0AAU6W1F1_9CAUD
MKPLTTKQRHIMKIIVMGNLDATGSRVSNVDVYQLQTRLPYETSRESLMCSLAILKKQGWFVPGGKQNRDGRMKQTLEPTAVAIRVVTPPKPVAEPEYVETEEDDVVLLELT